MTDLRRLAWRWPHWWAAALSGAGWCWFLARWWSARGVHAHGTGFSILDWAVMVIAMMLPLVFAHMRFTAARSLWHRRQRALLAFTCGYLGAWLLAGLAALAGWFAFGQADLEAWPWLASMAFGVAALWQLVPLKQRALVACHRTVPLAPRGWRADRDCLLYGWTIGTRCLVTCGGLMLACVVAGHGLFAMLGASAIAGAERYSVRANGRTTSVALASMAVVFAVLVE